MLDEIILLSSFLQEKWNDNCAVEENIAAEDAGRHEEEHHAEDEKEATVRQWEGAIILPLMSQGSVRKI